MSNLPKLQASEILNTRRSFSKEESNLVFVVGSVGGGGIVGEQSIGGGVGVSGAEGEEPIGEDDEEGGGDGDFDLPQGRDEEMEESRIHRHVHGDLATETRRRQ